MSRLTRDLGVQSYCFRAFKDNARTAELTREIGVEAIELCNVHVDFDDPAAHDAAIQTYRDAGVQILSIGVQTLRNQPEVEAHWFDFARKAGAKYMSVHFEPDTWQEAARTGARLAEEHGLRLAIHNHGGYHWLGSSQMLKHVFANTPKTIGLCLDTAWCLDAGENPVEWVQTFGDRLYGLHIKDFIFHRDRSREDVVVGTGNLDLAQLSDACEKVGFAGYAVLEYEGDVKNPTPALKQCVEKVRAAG